MCKQCLSYQPHVAECNDKLNSWRGNSGMDRVIDMWVKDNMARWEKVTAWLRDYTFTISGVTLNEDNNAKYVASEFANEYRAEIDAQFDGDWWEQYLLYGITSGMLRAETRLEAIDKLKANLDVKDFTGLNEQYKSHVQTYLSNAIEANVEAVTRTAEEYLREFNPELYVPGESENIHDVLINKQKAVGELRTNAIAQTRSVGIYNETLLIYYVANSVISFKIVTNDPCPICQELAEDTYTIEQARNYQISIDKTFQVTGYSQGSNEKYYAENPYVGMIPVHVNCVCYWEIGEIL